MTVLLLYSTVDGHTLEICAAIARTLESEGSEVEMVSLDSAPTPSLRQFDRVVIGASIRYGRHRENVAAFMNAHADELARARAVFFSVSLVARKASRNTADTNPYVKRFLRMLSWRPREVAVFAGKLDYPRYGFRDRQMIRLIMWLTGGPTDPAAVVDFTDWGAVEAFARRLLPSC